MAVDTPATIAILGAGPIGIEAALYARYLGYHVTLFEQAVVASHVLHGGHVPVASPFAKNCSPLGLAALRAQDPDHKPPDGTALLTRRQWAEQYLVPLSQTDLIVDHILPRTRVIAVTRERLFKTDMSPGVADRADQQFHVLVENAEGNESIHAADLVLDVTGVMNQPVWCGVGGIPAIGERLARESIEYGIPDVPGEQRAHYAERHTLVVGDGAAAARTVIELARLTKRFPNTRVHWIGRSVKQTDFPWPSQLADPAIARESAQLVSDAIQLATDHPNAILRTPELGIQAIHRVGLNALQVTFDGVDEPETFDRIVANVGYRPDHSLLAELHVPICCMTEAVSHLANRLQTLRGADNSHSTRISWAELLVTPEPNLYVLGAKSLGRYPGASFSTGLDQIRALFSIIGGRADLDLYATA